MKEILFASTNQSKIEEVKAIFKAHAPNVRILTLTDLNLNLDDVEENGTSYLQNAYIKAKAAFEKSNMPVIADDSGYEVKQWDGLPGLYTRRLYKEYPVEKLDMNQSTEIIQHSAICYMYSPLRYKLIENKVNGTLINELRGEHLSYYTNAMIPDTYSKTFIELGHEFIAEHSSRALCIKELIKSCELNVSHNQKRIVNRRNK